MMDYAFLQPWHDFLPRDGGHVISCAGGGGKTSLLRALADVYRREGRPVMLTTTTRTEPLDWPELQVQEWVQIAGGEQPSPYGFLRNGCHEDGKWRGLSTSCVDELGWLLPDHVVIVEADGSGGRPVKLHRPDEPLWPARTSLAILVMGLSALGRPVGEVLHRHGRGAGAVAEGYAREFRDLPGDDPWTWQHMFRLLCGPHGYLARVPAGVPIVLALTQLGGLADSLGLFGFAGRAMEEAHIPLVLFCELAAEPMRIRTAYRTGPETAGP